jgi:hypothetical protein
MPVAKKRKRKKRKGEVTIKQTLEEYRAQGGKVTVLPKPQDIPGRPDFSRRGSK